MIARAAPVDIGSRVIADSALLNIVTLPLGTALAADTLMMGLTFRTRICALAVGAGDQTWLATRHALPADALMSTGTVEAALPSECAGREWALVETHTVEGLHLV
jgi:hypothetical protein